RGTLARPARASLDRAGVRSRRDAERRAVLLDEMRAWRDAAPGSEGHKARRSCGTVLETPPALRVFQRVLGDRFSPTRAAWCTATSRHARGVAAHASSARNC